MPGKLDSVQDCPMHEACNPVSSMTEIKFRRGRHRFSCTNTFLCAWERYWKYSKKAGSVTLRQPENIFKMTVIKSWGKVSFCYNSDWKKLENIETISLAWFPLGPAQWDTCHSVQTKRTEERPRVQQPSLLWMATDCKPLNFYQLFRAIFRVKFSHVFNTSICIYTFPHLLLI